MAADMKETIALAARTLLFEKRVKKLTVKDIVEECRITRQTFYYHFADIPDLLRWAMKQGITHWLKGMDAQTGPEEKLRFFFLTAVNSIPYIRRSQNTNYAAEIRGMLTDQAYDIFDSFARSRHLYANLSQSQFDLVKRYHCQAIMGILAGWTDADSENLDEIVHTVYRLITEGIPPQTKTGPCPTVK